MGIYQDLELWAKTKEASIRAEYENEKDTGRLADSLSSEVVKTDTGYHVVFKALGYAYEKEYGRGKTTSKTKSTFFDDLQGWVSRHMSYKDEKQLKSITYAVWKNIHEKGITVPNEYSKGGYVAKHINDTEIKKLLDTINGSVVENIKETLFNPKQWQ